MICRRANRISHLSDRPGVCLQSISFGHEHHIVSTTIDVLCRWQVMQQAVLFRREWDMD